MVVPTTKERVNVTKMEHPARRITKIAREAEHLVMLAMRGDGIGTAEIDCIHAVRHHPGITQAELAAALHSDKAAIARRTASLERKGYLRREPNPEDGRSQLLYATEQAEGLRNAKAEAESAFYDYLMAGLDEEQGRAFLTALDTLYRRSKEESRAGFPHMKAVLEGKTYAGEE